MINNRTLYAKKTLHIAGLPVIIVMLVNCSKEDVTTTTPLKALPLTVSTPANNSQTDQKTALGRLLFWDPVLSGGKEVACASCHHPSLGYSDGLAVSIRVNGQGLGTLGHFSTPNTIPFVKRNSLSIINLAFNGISEKATYDPSTAPMFLTTEHTAWNCKV